MWPELRSPRPAFIGECATQGGGGSFHGPDERLVRRKSIPRQLDG